MHVQAVMADLMQSGYTHAYAVVKILRSIFDVAVDVGCIVKSPIPSSFKTPKRPTAKQKNKEVATTLGVYTHFDKESRQKTTFSKVRDVLEGRSVEEGKTEESPKEITDSDNSNIIKFPFSRAVNN